MQNLVRLVTCKDFINTHSFSDSVDQTFKTHLAKPNNPSCQSPPPQLVFPKTRGKEIDDQNHILSHRALAPDIMIRLDFKDLSLSCRRKQQNT